MAEYNVNEFRSNIRKAFDEAERGEPVYIDRYDKTFVLIEKQNWDDTIMLAQHEAVEKNNSLPQAETESDPQ